MYYEAYGDQENENKNEEKKITKKEKDIIYDWISKYNEPFCKFILICLSKESFENIDKNINELIEDITKEMDTKWGNKNKNNNKSTDCVVANDEDLEKWMKKKNIIMDEINKVLIATHLYLKIFQTGHIMVSSSKQEQKEDNNDDDEDLDEEEQRRKMKSILSGSSRNKVCGILINNWLTYNLDIIYKLNELSQCVGIDFNCICNLVKQLHNEHICFIGELISECIVNLSSSQWQCLWDFGITVIKQDNNKSKCEIIKRKQMEQDNKQDNYNDNDDEFNGNDVNEKILKFMK
eukprot:135779_1